VEVLVQSTALERQMDAEFQFHLESQINDYVEQGLSRETRNRVLAASSADWIWRKRNAETKGLSNGLDLINPYSGIFVTLLVR